MTRIEYLYRLLIAEQRFSRGGAATGRERRESRARQASLALELAAITGTAAHVWTRRAARANTEADVEDAAARRWAPLQLVLDRHLRDAKGGGR